MKLGMKTVLVVACLGLAACTSDLEPSDPNPAPAPAAVEPSKNIPAVALAGGERARPAEGIDAVGAEYTKPAAGPFVCRKNAFCEDFEEQSWTTRWNDVVTTDGGKIELGRESASSGRGALRLSAHDAASTAFLVAEPGVVAGDWSGLLGFAFRLDQIPAKYVGGPELTVQTADGPITVRIAVRPEGVVLEQLAGETCLRDRCQPSSRIIAAAQPNHWYRVRLGLEVNPSEKAPYGRIEVSVDGGELQSQDLTVPFFEGRITMRAGITQGDTRRALADLDDVTMLIRE